MGLKASRIRVPGLAGHDDPAAAAEHEFAVIAACLAADHAVDIAKPIEVDYD